MKPLVHASLFSGFGGPDLAARWMGWNNAFHCEINEFCNTILDYHFPESQSYKDVTTTDFTEWRGKVNVLTGGFPCQPFSVAGQRKGADDNRYLWPHMLRVIREVQPDWVIGENVAGILTMVQPGTEIEVEYPSSLLPEDYPETALEQEFVIETICQDLEREGYSVQPIVIPACAVGAPHRRDRVWFVASRNTPSDAHCRANTGKPREYEEAGRKERVQEWNEIRKSVEPGCVRRIVSNANCIEYSSCGSGEKAERIWSRNDGEQKEWGQQAEWIDGLHGLQRNAAHTLGQRCNNGWSHWKERSIRYDRERNTTENKPERFKRKCRACTNSTVTPYTNSIRLQAGVQSAIDESFRRETPYRYAAEPTINDWRALHPTSWKDFPTQPPVCGGDDGLSYQLDGITFPKWRQESIKGYGNAIVPQVVLTLFEAIEETYKSL